MNKKAGLLTKTFVAMDAVDGAKKVKNTFNASANNKFDNEMGTSLKDNIPNLKTASEQIDILYKQAFNMSNVGKNISSGFNKAQKYVNKLDTANTRHLKCMADGIKNRNFGKALKEGVQAAKVTVPAVGGMVGAGVLTSKGLKKIDEKITKEKIQPDRELEYNTIGAGLTAGLALNALSKKRVLAPYKTAIGLVNKDLVKTPMKIIKNSKAGKIVADTLKKSTDAMSKANGKITKDISNNSKDLFNMMNGKHKMNSDQAISAIIKKRKNNFMANKMSGGVAKDVAEKEWNDSLPELKKSLDIALNKMNKKASDILDDMEKLAGPNAEYFKDVFKNHFIKEGIKSIPYYAAPAALSMALSRDLRHGLKKIDNVKDPNNDINDKTAAIKMPKIDTNFAKEMFEKGVDGVARTVFPATVMTVTGRNITNAFEKIDRDDNRNMQENMANKIIVQINSGDSKRKIKRNVSKQLDDQLFKKADESPEKTINDNLKKEIEQHTGKNIPIQTNKINIGLGKKKLFRLKS